MAKVDAKDSNSTVFTNIPSELQGNGADYIGIENLDMVFKTVKVYPKYEIEEFK